jgi:putative acetyltransferase
VRRDDAKVIGSIGLHPDRMRGFDGAKMLGYVLAQPYWGRGLMTEAAKRVIAFAFEEMNLEVLSVIHYPFNARSKRVIEKCGFVYEGTLRRAGILHDGAVCDACCYSMLKSEYLPPRP